MHTMYWTKERHYVTLLEKVHTATKQLRCCSIWLCEFASDLIYRVDLLR